MAGVHGGQHKEGEVGLAGATAADDSTQVDQMLENVSQYAPNALYRDITVRATSLAAVWTLDRDSSTFTLQ